MKKQLLIAGIICGIICAACVFLYTEMDAIFNVAFPVDCVVAYFG